MNTTNDPLERLAAADPLPDAERLTAAEQREAEALLERLLAEPVAPRQRRLPLRPIGAVAAAACALVLVLAAGGLFDDDQPGVDVVARAVAAVTDDDSIFHIVEHVTVRQPDGLSQSAFKEAWYAPDGSAHEKHFYDRGGRRGALAAENAGRLPPSANGRRGGLIEIYNPRTNEIFRTRFGSVRVPETPTLDQGSDPGARLRELERSGDLRLAGTTDVDGREAYRLVSGQLRGFDPGTVQSYEYVVDAETYYPLTLRQEIREGERTTELITRFRVYETIPFDARGREQLDLDPHPGARVRYGAGVGPNARDRDGR
jgi:hypothetical protein